MKKDQRQIVASPENGRSVNTEYQRHSRTRNYDHSSTKPKYSKWKYLVIVVCVLLLGLSALPNVYRLQAVVKISAEGNQQRLLDSNQLFELLSAEEFKVKSISADNRSDGKTSRIILDSEKQAIKAALFLRNKLGDNYLISTQMEDTIPGWLKSLGAGQLELGLDLSGGVLFILKVDSQKAYLERLENIKQTTHSLLRELRLRGFNVSVKNGEMIALTYSKQLNIDPFKLTQITQEIKQIFPELTIEKVDEHHFSMFYMEKDKLKFHQEVMLQSLTTLRGRIEQLGITEAVTQRQGKDKIRIELPGVKNPDEAKKIIGATASLDFYQLMQHGGKKIKTKDGREILVDPMVIFSGQQIKNAQAGRDEMGMPLVHLTLDNIGGDKMLKFSKENIGNPMVTVFSEYYQNTNGQTDKKSKVISVATIQAVLGAKFSITNLPSNQEAQELALLLRAGSLTAPITIIKQRTIEATLGESNINNGMAALMLGVGLTLTFMALWYRRLGLIANAALLLNLVSLLGLMSLLPGTVLTLPGIAGLVLTVGMAVDTNVIIFERIKEERKRGRSLFMAVEQGYKNAFATILDANVTTMLVALILYAIGYGPVKGFAITLGLGILTSMFTGVFISHALTHLLYVKPKYNKKNINETSNSNSNQAGII